MMAIIVQTDRIQRVRGPNLAVLVKGNAGIPMEEALRRADDAGAVIASNKRFTKALVQTEEWQAFEGPKAYWAGTMTGYERPNQKLGHSIEYADPKSGLNYVFPVPAKYVGMKNVVLVAEHPDYALGSYSTDRIVITKNVGIVEGLPESAGYYPGDPIYDLPTGKEIPENSEKARFLDRLDKRVGLVARGFYIVDYDSTGQSVFLSHSPSHHFGVVVEAAAGAK
jgi:hypothetical protein